MDGRSVELSNYKYRNATLTIKLSGEGDQVKSFKVDGVSQDIAAFVFSPTKNLEQSWQRKADEAHDRVMKAIRELKAHGMPINFNTVHIESGASKSYLYKTPEIRETIEAERSSAAARAGAWHKKYDRTSRSKDVVIEA